MGSIGFQDKPLLAIRAALGTAQARALASVPIGTGSGPHAHVLSVIILPHIPVASQGTVCGEVSLHSRLLPPGIFTVGSGRVLMGSKTGQFQRIAIW